MTSLSLRNCRVLFLLCTIALFLLVTPIYAQEPIAIPELTEQESQQLEQQLQKEQQQHDQCFQYYHFGSVTFDISDNTGISQVYNAGQQVTVNGTIVNPNNYPLTEGTVVAVVRREDNTVSGGNWHPGIEQVSLPDTYDLPANGSTPFTFTWRIPATAPEGFYFVEFSYLMGGRYVISGIPYVTNFSGGRTTFEVRQGGPTHAAHFFRNTVMLNGSPLNLRAVPPTLSPDTPVTVDVSITALGPTTIPVTLSKSLYKWSSTDGEPPVVSDTEKITLVPGVNTPVNFTWNTQKPGTYEYVITATSDDPTILPSMIKVRFPIEGNVPRIVYAGLGGYEEDKAIIVTCVVNATYGTGTGEITTQVLADNQNIASEKAAIDFSIMTSTVTKVPRSAVEGTSLAIAATATDESGNVTDKHTVNYKPARTGGTEEGTDATGQPKTTLLSGRLGIILVFLILVFVTLIAIVIVIVVRRSKQPPSDTVEL